jgi:hypothetical protein
MKVKSSINNRIARVAFRLEDAVSPDHDSILSHVNGEVEVIGKIVFQSEGATQKDEFAIVEVPGIFLPLIVPQEKLRTLTMRNAESDADETAELRKAV